MCGMSLREEGEAGVVVCGNMVDAVRFREGVGGLTDIGEGGGFMVLWSSGGAAAMRD